MATKFVIKQEDARPFSEKWNFNFFQGHPEIETKYNRLLNKKQVQNCTEEIFLECFNLYFYLCNIYNIEKKDMYNMDKKYNALG